MGSSPHSASQRKKLLSLSQAEKAAFLSQPENYPEHTKQVVVIQTHHAWVFLTDKYAYKMKKSLRYPKYDLSSLELRRHYCSEEYRLNLRLAGRTYIGVVPLVAGEDCRLKLGAEGTVVEWLVKMHRLPEERLLDKAAANGLVTVDDISRLMEKLRRFYRVAPACDHGTGNYAAYLRHRLDRVAGQLRVPRYRFPGSLLRDVIGRQENYITSHRDSLEQRQLDGHVREVHGDLRPEHVCLLPDAEPEIIDCLEFDPQLRCLDWVEDLACLGMECRMIGQGWIDDKITAWARRNDRDDAPRHMWRFYAARRASTRAMLCAWHTQAEDDADHWLERGREYLRLALSYLESFSGN